MSHRLAAGALLGLLALVAAGCAGTPAYVESECPVFTGLGTVRANPAGALHRHLALEAGFRVCPPQEGLAELQRKHIELRHEVLALLSGMTETALTEPLRVEKLQQSLLRMVNDRIMRRGRVTAVYITAFELE